jgi:2-haloalkanoic acid dehalogenase type II
MPPRVDVVLFDLLTALLDSWTLWDAAAGSRDDGRRWRLRYLELTYGSARYEPYDELVLRSALDAGLQDTAAETLLRRWDELAPWPEVPGVLRELCEVGYRLGVVTNCSEVLGERAAARLGVPVHVVTAERVGAYKPNALPYRLALDEMGADATRTLFVAGSPADIGGASAVGMSVVWHNRVGLAPPPTPVARLETLDELPPRLRAGW